MSETTPDAPDIRGGLDGIRGSHVFGWAAAENAPERRFVVRLEIDGEPVEQMVADLFRQDLADAGYGDGRHAYRFSLPDRVRDGRLHQIGIILDDTSRHLHNSPRAYSTAAMLTAARYRDGECWIDRPGAPDEVYHRLDAGEISFNQARDLLGWQRDGYLVLADEIHPDLLALAQADIATIRAELLPTAQGEPSLGGSRVLDPHAVSDALAEIVLTPRVVGLCRAIFAARPAVLSTACHAAAMVRPPMTALPFLHVPRPARTALALIARDDAELVRFPGSHRLVPPCDFGDDNVLAFETPHTLQRLTDHVAAECARLALVPRRITLRAGDIVLLHPALVHALPDGSAPERRYLTLSALYAGCADQDETAHAAAGRAAFSRNGGVYFAAEGTGFAARSLRLPRAAFGAAPG